MSDKSDKMFTYFYETYILNVLSLKSLYLHFIKISVKGFLI